MRLVALAQKLIGGTGLRVECGHFTNQGRHRLRSPTSGTASSSRRLV